MATSSSSENITFKQDLMTFDDEGFLLSLPPLPETDDFAIYGTIHAYSQHADALAEVYRETTRLAASEPGTIYYCIGRDPDDPTVFHMFERYRGKQGFDAHNDNPVVQKLIADELFRGVKAKFVFGLKPSDGSS